MIKTRPQLYLVLLILVLYTTNANAKNKSIILQSTTSTANSGLYKYILPIFTKKTGIKVHVVAVGTGQALKNAENGDGDVIMVHDRKAEEDFVKNGYGIEHHKVMYNDFVIIGPMNDPAKVKSAKNIHDALWKISQSDNKFISRSDNSGTHRKEHELWGGTKIDVKKYSGQWYMETGSGMASALNMTIEMNGYTLTDRATWITFKNKYNHRILFEQADKLINQYSIILVNPEKHKHIRAKEGLIFIKWITGHEGQKTISEFKIKNQQLFFPNAN